MYLIDSHKKDREIKVRFDHDTMQAITALANITRKQRAVFIRGLVMEELKRRSLETLSRELPANGRP